MYCSSILNLRLIQDLSIISSLSEIITYVSLHICLIEGEKRGTEEIISVIITEDDKEEKGDMHWPVDLNLW